MDKHPVPSYPMIFSLSALAAMVTALTSCCGPQPQSCCGEMAPSGIVSEVAPPNGGSKVGTLGFVRPGREREIKRFTPVTKDRGMRPRITTTTATTPCDSLVPKAQPPKQQNPLPVEPLSREGSLSCWSTCGQMIMKYIGGIDVRQCCQSSRALINRPCCDSVVTLPSNGECDVDGYPNFHSWGFFGGDETDTILSWEQVQKEIDEGRPFAFSYVDKVFSPGIEHMVVVIGWELDGTEQGLVVLNPRGFQNPAAQDGITYSDYAGNAQFENKMNFYGIKAP